MSPITLTKTTLLLGLTGGVSALAIGLAQAAGADRVPGHGSTIVTTDQHATTGPDNTARVGAGRVVFTPATGTGTV